MKHTNGRQLSHAVLEQYRYRAIQLQKKGWQIGEIAEAFGVNRRAVSRWFTLYRRNGRSALKSKTAHGPCPKLSDEDMRKIISFLKEPADAFGFETPLWSCHSLQQLIEKKLHKKLHVSSVWRWLMSWGFTNQVPDRHALERDDRKVKRWKKEEWPKIQAHQHPLCHIDTLIPQDHLRHEMSQIARLSLLFPLSYPNRE
jgi:transposase